MQPPSRSAAVDPFNNLCSGDKNGIGGTVTAGNICQGLSDGTLAFDTQRTDGQNKLLAAQAFKAQQTEQAKNYWQQAIQQEPYDAEALIYLEDQCVRDSGRPYIILVATAILEGVYINSGRSDLQGIFFAQHEYNTYAGLAQCQHIPAIDFPSTNKGTQHVQALPENTLVLVVIANLFTDAAHDKEASQQIAQQIIQYQQSNYNPERFIGIIGLPTSNITGFAMPILNRAHLPAVSQNASGDNLAEDFPYFRSVTPTNNDQARALSDFIQVNLSDKLHKKLKHGLILGNQDDLYSQNLADDFEHNFAGPDTSSKRKNYSKITPQYNIHNILNTALDKGIDFIFFAGNSDDASELLQDPLLKQEPYKHIPIIGGDTLYNLRGNYPDTARGRMYFVGFAFPDEWDQQQQMPLFLQNYGKNPLSWSIFDPTHKQCPDGPYGCDRADNHAILSYDATKTLLEAARRALLRVPTPPHLTEEVNNQLNELHGANTVQGVSGLLDFAPNEDGVTRLQNKTFLILSIDEKANTHIEYIEQQDHLGS
ncbi:hypothetical protein EPA93_37230 [Ktedonosporobacter rubrisoli]|uniref:Receptor ligand binding region domain-containing protein n=1 Tax=Ktedonosporobacter rubrisoli TaxID=2509675 RepID=A0A4P6JZI6_KTERU|nr:hypothetical protein [Ktedonosporobacter rubrisoli]QBD81318.1 hypothetical protein EPA93_37230 [Ktedonosporobacter rubrisoli]